MGIDYVKLVEAQNEQLQREVERLTPYIEDERNLLVDYVKQIIDGYKKRIKDVDENEDPGLKKYCQYIRAAYEWPLNCLEVELTDAENIRKPDK